MKRIHVFVGMMILLYTATLSATSINGRIIFLSTDSLKLKVILQVNTDTGIDDMGGATIVLAYDSTVISFKSNPQKDIDYFFHNFCSNSYNVASVTKPLNNRLWLNIDLPPNSNNNGTIVAGLGNWTDLVTLTFDIINPNGTPSLVWLTNNIFWGIYDADNATAWNIGEFEDQSSFVLPVELTSFVAEIQKNESVLLKWTTISSLNNLGFEIEKIQASTGDWGKIGFVQGMGNTTLPVEYSFIDKTNHNSAIIKYRIKSVGVDGFYEYSDEIELDVSPQSFELLQNYPNPFNPSTKIVVRLAQATKMRLNIYNLIGEVVREVTSGEEFEAGTHEFNFDASGLASGVYIYRIESPAFNETKKMVLLR